MAANHKAGRLVIVQKLSPQSCFLSKITFKSPSSFRLSLHSYPLKNEMETRVSKLKLAVILIVMRKRLMCSSCILWPTLCSAICLCQLPLSQPTLNIILKSTGSLSSTADRQAFCRRTWCEVPTPTPPRSALLVKPSLTPIPLLGKWSDTRDGSWLGKPAATASQPCQRAQSNICPHNRRWSRASRTYSCHRTQASLSWAIILFLSLVFICCPSFLELNDKLLGSDYPIIFPPSTEWAPKGVLGKLVTWPTDYTLSIKDGLVLKRGRRAGGWLRSKKCSLSSILLGLAVDTCVHISLVNGSHSVTVAQLSSWLLNLCASLMLYGALEMQWVSYFLPNCPC